MAKIGVEHPYIPNSVQHIQEEMLKEIGAKDVEELLAVIPTRFRMNRPLNLPEALTAEHELRSHLEEILSKNRTCKDHLNFLGAGCWQHYVPAVCDEIGHRAEFVTAYSADAHSDLGKWQAFFEFQSMMGALLGMEVVSLPTYDWGSAAGFALRMASRMTGRHEVLVSKTTSPERLAVIRSFCQPEASAGHMTVRFLDYDPHTGSIDLETLKGSISSKTAAVYFENPSYLGTIEPQGEDIAKIAHRNGAECIVGVDPISLGVLSPPGEYGADMACGDIQPLGIHMSYGGGLGGFIASRDEVRYVSEYPTYLVSIASTNREGEIGFGLCTHERTLYRTREKGRDFTGTTVGLWTVVAAVYLALMGPHGMKEIGQTIIEKSHYAAESVSKIKGVRILFSPSFFKEFVVNFDETNKHVKQINQILLKHEIFGGKDIAGEFPELGKSALYCVTEIHSKEDIERLASALEEAVR
jgi:glycine dehydrogenase subunit 1